MSPLPEPPEDPRLRAIAHALEQHGAIAELMDPKWRVVYITSEMCKMIGFPAEEATSYYGISPIVRNARYEETWATDDAGLTAWGEAVLPSLLHDVPPQDPDFEQVFGDLAVAARELDPADPPPLMIPLRMSFPGLNRVRLNWLGDVDFLYQRIHDAGGSLVGVANITRGAMPGTLAARLARGPSEMFERMERLADPGRRAAAILFADLEASGALSRRLSSGVYFDLIRSLTDLIDGSVMEHRGITGKHAGDGASALFVPEGDEAPAAADAVAAARAIRLGAKALSADAETEVRVNIGLHWGATLTVGQVSAQGRLEVTALGDEMNEAARIEGVASEGRILASKQLIERLTPGQAAELGIDPDGLTYTPLSELGAGEKALRDAGTIAVTEL